jgi:hypothetical protein
MRQRLWKDATVLKQFKETYEAKYQEEIETSQRFENVAFGFMSGAIEFWGSATRKPVPGSNEFRELFFSLLRETGGSDSRASPLRHDVTGAQQTERDGLRIKGIALCNCR